MTENYRGCYEYLSAQYPEVGGYEFYKELFPDNENSGERHTDFSHPNAVYQRNLANILHTIVIQKSG